MHKLMEYVCNELEELEKKAGNGGKLSMQEIEYADRLTSIKKNILRTDELMRDSEYSQGGYYPYGWPMRTNYYGAKSQNRDAMGRFSRTGNRDRDNSYGYGNSYAETDIMSQLEDLKRVAPENVRQDIQRIIQKVEGM